jgi:hypothetical protein
MLWQLATKEVIEIEAKIHVFAATREYGNTSYWVW